MRKEPEIVHILREEERLRNSQMNSSHSCDNATTSEDASIDTIIKKISEKKQAEHLLFGKMVRWFE